MGTCTYYVAYKGEEVLGVWPSLIETAQALGLRYQTAAFLATPTTRKRRAQSTNAKIIEKVVLEEYEVA